MRDHPNPTSIPFGRSASPVQALSRFEPLIGFDRYSELMRAATGAGKRLRGRTVWNFNSTSSGGGVAEMLEVLVGYIKDAGVDIRWHVITGDAKIFSITKRVHNRLHGAAGDAGGLGAIEAEHYATVTAANAEHQHFLVARGDVVLLHDPQTVGMAGALADLGAHVISRCHVGSGDPMN